VLWWAVVLGDGGLCELPAGAVVSLWGAGEGNLLEDLWVIQRVAKLLGFWLWVWVDARCGAQQRVVLAHSEGLAGVAAVQQCVGAQLILPVSEASLRQ